jgi:hypothetical protein
MKNRFAVTYEIVTPESAEHGDVEEHGYVLPGGWRYDIDTVLADKEGEYRMTLREAIGLVGCLEYTSNARCYAEADGTCDYIDGSHERKALHLPENITPASRRRVDRILRAERFFI